MEVAIVARGTASAGTSAESVAAAMKPQTILPAAAVVLEGLIESSPSSGHPLWNASKEPAKRPARRPLVVGLTGPNAAGKGEAAACLMRRGFACHSLSDIVREEAAARGLSHSREDLIAVGNALRAAEGPGILAERLLSRLGGRDVVDSIRNPHEAAILRRIPGFVLIGLTAPVAIRFERSLARGRLGDDETLEEFELREEQENSSDPARQQIRATLEMADHVIENASTLADLERALLSVLGEV